MRCTFSGRAELDLEEIADYIAQGNPPRHYPLSEKSASVAKPS
ncbi:hypothetical protein [Methylococcus mesophilus]|nr:hypothetical protein [Methylococcus mesophilus]UZR27349.1 hypothetical protein OOT43_11445 [Methylococcus mesophilus]